MYVFTVILGLFTIAAQAQYVPRCGESYAFDSYSIGVKIGYTNRSITMPSSRLVDNTCIQLGIQKGQDLRARFCKTSSNPKDDCMGRNIECAKDLIEGRRRGFMLSTPSGGSECFNAGYNMGKTKLDYIAREQDVSIASKEDLRDVSLDDLKKCTQSYLDGYASGKAGLGGTFPNSNPEAYCYALGHYEWSLVPEPKKP